MRHPVKIKTAAFSIPLRKAALSASATARRTYPAWIDADERIASFPATAVSQRVRDALVLRQVVKGKSRNPKASAHGASTR